MGASERSLQANVSQYRASWQDEIESASLYQVLAEVESQAKLAELYRRLAATEDHARFWEERLRTAGQPTFQRRLAGVPAC